MRLLVTFGCLLVLAGVAGCTHKAAPGESIPEVCRLDNNRKNVKASGYLHAPILVGCDTKDCALQLVATHKEVLIGGRVSTGRGSG